MTVKSVMMGETDQRVAGSLVVFLMVIDFAAISPTTIDCGFPPDIGNGTEITTEPS